MTSTNTPVCHNERADILDILRGFALLGIGIANYAVFSLYIYQSPAAQKAFSTSAIDEWLQYITTALVEGKFYSLFSMLFGIGFSIILTRRQKDGNGLIIFYRRLFALLCFGLAHCFLVWDGDILFFYAVAGMLLPLFRNLSDRTLLALVLILLLSPLVFDVIKVITHGKWNIANPVLKIAEATDKQYGILPSNYSTWLIIHNSYSDLLKWNHSGFLWGWQLRLDSNRVLKVLAMFLLGYYIGRKQIYVQLAQYRQLLKKIQRRGFLIGLPAGIALAYFQHDPVRLPKAGGLLDTVSYTLNVVPLCLAYVSTIALAWMHNKQSLLLRMMAPTGRMGLTNYLMQSFFAVLFFYGIGLGFGSTMGPSHYLFVIVLFYCFQLLYSNWWLMYFQYGPFEWVWRQLTYWKRLPLKKV
jgi:uncharacterized protein